MATARAVLSGVITLLVSLGALSCRTQHPKTIVRLVESHEESFEVWRERGVRGRTVVHLDDHADAQFIPEGKMAEILSLLRANRDADLFRRSGPGQDGLLNLGNFLHGAWKAGLVERAFWVFDSTPSRDARMLEESRQKLIWTGYPAAEIERTFRLEAGRVTGTLSGLPFTVSALADVPAGREPVLLDIDSDYFVGLLERYPGLSLEDHFARFREDLRRSGLSWDIVTIAYSVEWNFTPLEYRFIGDALRDMFARPDLELPPEAAEIFALRSRADREYRAGRTAAATELVRTILARKPGDAPASYLLTLLLVASGDFPQALAQAETAARSDPAYAAGMVQLARRISGRDSSAALAFLRKAREIAPGLKGLNEGLGDIFFNRGEYRQALESYLKVLPPTPAVQMYLGDTYMMLKEPERAMERYSSGEASMAGTPYRIDQFPASLLFMGEYHEKTKRDPAAAREYYDRYLRIHREKEEQQEAVRAVRERSRLYP